MARSTKKEAPKAEGALAKWGGTNLPTMDPKKAAAVMHQGADESSSAGDTVFLGFSGKAGTYRLGRDKTDLDPDQIFAIDPSAPLEGWNCWKGNQVAKKFLWNMFERGEKGVLESELPDMGPFASDGDGWKKVLGLTMVDVDDEKMQRVVFTTDSASGRNVFAGIMDEIANRIGEGVPDTVALVSWDKEQFTAQGQTNWKPKVTVEGYCSQDELMAMFADPEGDVDKLLDGDYAGEQSASEPEVEETEEVEEPAPEPKRKRRAAA